MASESVREMWLAYLAQQGVAGDPTHRPLSSWHFCDNEADANACADLVKRGMKTATATYLAGDTAPPARGPHGDPVEMPALQT